MTSIDSIKKGLAAYLDNELMPQIPAGETLKKFGTGVIISLAISRLDNIIRELAANSLVSASGLVTAEEIDLEALKAAAVTNMPETGLEFELPMFGKMKINRGDVNTLCATIQQYEEA